MRDDRARLLDVQEAIDRIQRRTAIGRAAFERDELIQTWVVHHLQIVGEACRTLSAEIKADNPQVPWQQIVGMRNILVHDYFRIDVDAVWNTVHRDLPALKAEVARILGVLS